MVSLEQVKLLETKVAKAVEYVERVTGENAALLQKEAAMLQKEAELRAKLASYQKRIDELEVLVARFKEEQSRIEDGILSALDRLNQFEDAIEKSLSGKQSKSSDSKAAPAQPPKGTPAKEAPGAKPPPAPKETSSPKETPPAPKETPPAPKETPVRSETPGEGAIFFEIPEAESAEDDIEDPLEDLQLGENDTSSANGELDIF
jgi:hypothetical protein